MAEGLRLDDWIGERVTVNILREPVGDPNDEPIVEIEGFLEGVDPMGIIVLFGLGDVYAGSERDCAQPDVPRQVFYAWRRIQSIEHIKGENK